MFVGLLVVPYYWSTGFLLLVVPSGPEHHQDVQLSLVGCVCVCHCILKAAHKAAKLGDLRFVSWRLQAVLYEILMDIIGLRCKDTLVWSLFQLDSTKDRFSLLETSKW